ncbi:acetyl-CoA carboxylase biotin carboxylase subunit family protein [Streptomyces sp. NPDC005551]|uniref:ATP-grasp domain-containing protein n=1 Tax=Streptomyces sp. NPDC005551 TaxID=3364725 RepID=UPI00368F6E76
MTTVTTADTPRPHVVIVTRWQERYAEYGHYLDHGDHTVTYVATEVALPAIPSAAADVVTVARTDDLDEVRAAVHLLAARHGRPDRIVALKEDDLLIGAALRVEWDCPGDRPEDLLRFRDKHLMVEAVAAAGVPAPASAAVTGAADVAAFAAAHGWPVVLKPRVGSSSAGVLLVREPDELDGYDWAEPMLVQEFLPDAIYHVDGIFDGAELMCWRASRYVNTCLGFREGTFLGSVEEDDPAVLAPVGEHARAALAALTDRPTPFHLEVFFDARSGTCRFLEVGARVGGAEIPFIWRELHGYDLMEAAFRLQLGLPVHPVGPAPAEQVGGWLLVPAPEARPCRVTEVTPMTGREPGPYAEVLLKPGEVLPAADAYYEHVGGRFRFRAADSATVEHALTTTATAFRVSAEPLALTPVH